MYEGESLKQGDFKTGLKGSMKLRFYIVVSIMIALFGALNYFIGLRGWQFLGSKLSFLHITVYGTVFAAVVISSLVGMVANNHLPHFLRSSLYTLGSYWFAALTYFALIIVSIDIIRLLDRWIRFIPTVVGDKPNFALNMGILACVFVVVLLVYGTFNARNIKVTPYHITIPKQAGSLEQLRIAMISDLHLNSIDDQRQKRIIDTVNQLNPDLVLIAGDIIDDMTVFDKREMKKDFQNIKSKYGVYASLGNHDYLTGDLTYLITDQLKEAGIDVLRDSSVKVGESFYIIGREDKSYEMASGKKRMELSEIMNGIDRELPVIMLDHQPIDLEEAENAGVDLQLSGHTHKGQFFPFNLVTSRVFKIDHGHLETGSFQIIVSSGVGAWGPPVRIGTTPEVVDITVDFLEK
ncbi:MAG: metallophosphoesterase [Bacillota bacterium]